jgi:hypothetical protein
MNHPPKRTTRPRALTCCVCGQRAMGRQWWNRDNGFGICVRCAEDWERTYGDVERACGKRGVHWGVSDDQAATV